MGTSTGEREELLRSLIQFSSSVGWKACSRVTGDVAFNVVELLGEFDFKNLDINLDGSIVNHGTVLDGFPDFLLWLLSRVGDR